jgi:hypothetical protein
MKSSSLTAQALCIRASPPFHLELGPYLEHTAPYHPDSYNSSTKNLQQGTLECTITSTLDYVHLVEVLGIKLAAQNLDYPLAIIK